MQVLLHSEELHTFDTLINVPFLCVGTNGKKFHKRINEIKILPISDCYQLLAGQDLLAAMGAKLGTDRETGRPSVDCEFLSRGVAVHMRIAAMSVENPGVVAPSEEERSFMHQ